MSKILDDVKKTIGIDPSYTEFDVDLVLCTNAILGELKQIGVSDTDFVITTKNETWTDYLGAKEQILEMVKMYVCLKVRTMFDVQQSSSVGEAINAHLQELEWRIMRNLEGYFSN